MTTITINDINQLCAGDVAKFAYRGGHVFSGEVWEDEEGNQFVGGTLVRLGRREGLNEHKGGPSNFVTFISATRETNLPKALGSVIEYVTSTDGSYYCRAICNVDGEWEAVNDYGTHRLRPEEIASWVECRVEVLR